MHGRLTALCVVLALGCGSKTGLLIPDADLPFDAGMDAGFDAGIDAPMCMPQPVELRQRGAQIMFVLDRSQSMDDTMAGERRDPGDPRPSRWDVMADTFEAVFGGADPLLEIGAKIYPDAPDGFSTPEEACNVDRGVNFAPAMDRAQRLVNLIRATTPMGGTPTGAALDEVERFFSTRPAPGVPRFVVLATDGGPNCRPDLDVDPTRCLCTGRPEQCSPATAGIYAPYNCIDERRTLDVIARLAPSMPVYVIGIDDPTRPDLADVLDRMAIAGGRPRDPDAGRRFYSVARTADLEDALTTITDEIARCVFGLDPAIPPDASLSVSIGDVLVARDGTRSEGWDYTRADRAELTLFGGACERLTATGGPITAEILCDATE
ncbi:MAG: VWA domain-containing protein [Sandaracinaceae bacterium]|nr:VWA domain-containing protein [Sandaracinaceae bacterium]